MIRLRCAKPDVYAEERVKQPDVDFPDLTGAEIAQEPVHLAQGVG